MQFIKQYKLLHLIFCLLILFTCSKSASIDDSKFINNPRIILIDVGQTLITIDTYKSTTQHIGLGDLIGHIFSLFFNGHFQISKHMVDQYLNTLAKIPSPIKGPDYDVIGFNGKPMPSLQRDSFSGNISLNECRAIAFDWIEKNPHQFKSEKQKKIFQKMIDFNFDAEVYIAYQKYTKTIKLLQKLYEEKDENGKRKNICIILSNQPAEVIPLLKKHFPKIFNYSDEQVFSCDFGYLKPHPKIFEKCFSLCPKNCFSYCFFIDDEKGNHEASKKIKFKNYFIIPLYPKEAYKALEKFGILS